MDWQTFLFDPTQNIISTMEKIAYKRFYDQNLADEAFNECLDKLRENNWAKLQKYTGENNASPKTFFANVYTNLIEDFARSKLGRCTAPTWLERLGRSWKTLFKQLCCENKEPESLVVIHKTQGGDEDNYRDMIYAITQKIPNCGTKGKARIRVSIDDSDEETPIEIPTGNPSEGLDHDIVQDEFEDIMHAIKLWLSGEEIQKSNSHDLLKDLQALNLSDEVIVLFRCIYHEQMKLPAAAEFIGIKAHTARRRLNETLVLINQVFKKNQIDSFVL